MANTKITTNVIADDAITTAKIADDAVGNDQLASGLTLGGNTAATLSTAAQPNITSLGTLTSLQVNNTNINGNTISTTDTNGNLVITPNGTGNVNINTDTVAIMGAEGESAKLSLQADEADDNADVWSIISTTGNTLEIENNISGSAVAHMTFTPHATVASSTVSIPGKVGIGETTPLGQLHVKTADSGATADASADELVLEGSANSGMTILSGTGNTGSIYFGDSDLNYDGYIAYAHGGNRQMTIASAGGGNYIKLDATGHVGFSTTPTAWSSGYKSIQIGARGFVGAHTGSDLYLGQNAYFDSGWKYEASVAASLTQHSGGQITHKVAAAGTANNAITWIDALHMTTSGFVGINDTAPPRSLSITGVDGAYSGQTSGNSRTHLLLENNGSNYIEFLNAESNSAAIFWSNNDGQNQGAIEYKDSHMYLQAHGQANQLVLDSSNGYVHLTGSSDVRLTLSTEGTAGTNSANWVRGNSAGLSFNALTGGKFFWEIGGTEHMRLEEGVLRLKDTGTSPGAGSASETSFIYHDNSGATALCLGSNYESASAQIRFMNNTDVLGAMTGDVAGVSRFTWGRTSDSVSTNGFQCNGTGSVYASTSNSNNSYHYYNTSTGGYVFYVTASGSVARVSETTIGSDRRWKKNIVDIPEGLDTIKALRPVKYDWNESAPIHETDKRGFIAQEVEEVMPSMVGTFLSDSLPDAKSVATETLIPVLVKAIQELSAEVESLKEKLNG